MEAAEVWAVIDQAPGENAVEIGAQGQLSDLTTYVVMAEGVCWAVHECQVASGLGSRLNIEHSPCRDTEPLEFLILFQSLFEPVEPHADGCVVNAA